MGAAKQLEHLYVATLALLVVHEIDSAFWHEWDLFALGGGIQGFLLANLAVVVPFLYGLVRVVQEPRIGARFGLVLAVAGIAAFGIHTWFIVAGRPEFRLPASVMVLGGTLVASLALLRVSLRTLRGASAA
jgi:hypothetical protein